MLFFYRKGKQPFQLLFLLAVLFFVSCASHKKARVREEKVDKVIQTARTFTGTPYRYGGTTRAGMDCSALTIHSFRTLNMNLPRSAEDQSKVGKEVKLKELLFQREIENMK